MRATVLLAGVMCASLVAATQQVRDGAASPDVIGTARMSGTVIAMAGEGREPAPGRRALVTIMGTGLAVGRTVVTDDEGRFVFDGLPAGRFSVTASKPGYLTGAFGAARPGRTGVPVVLGDGEHRAGVSIGIAAGAVLSGTVRDAKGVPVLGAAVTAARFLPDGSTVSMGVATSDDRGEYRIYGLRNGEYVVSATSATMVSVGEIASLAAAEVDRRIARLKARQAPSAGSGPGEVVRPGAIFRGRYAPVFHPRAFTAAAADRLVLVAGTERPGVDIVLEPVSSHAIDGTISGAPAGAAVRLSLTQSAGGEQVMAAGPTLRPRSRGDGAFAFDNVVPGQYTITARIDRPAMWAREEITVGDEGAGGVALVMQPALHLTGKVSFEGERLAPPADLSAVMVQLVSLVRSAGAAAAGRGAVSGGADGQPLNQTDARGNFDVTVVPGDYLVTTTFGTTADGWWLRSAMVNGRDALDEPLRIEPGTPLAGAVLTFSDRHTQLSGTLVMPPGESAADYFIVVYPKDPSQWRAGARRIKSTRPGTDGHFIVRGLPPGAYLLAALTDVAPEDLIDRAFFTSLMSGSIPISLEEGEQKRQDVRIKGGK